MRLHSLELRNYKRFQNAKVQLDQPLIAFVGPNEAGKTSLLDAIRHLDSNESLHPTHVSRGISPEAGSIFLIALYLVENEDLASVDTSHATALPRWYVVNKQEGGRFMSELVPSPKRRLDHRAELARILGLASTTAALVKLLETTASTETDGSLLVRAASESANSHEQTLNDEQLATLRQLHTAVSSVSGERSNPTVGDLLDQLDVSISFETREHPEKVIREALSERRPDVLVFGEPERTLDSAYDLNVHASNPPIALKNLATLAGLDLSVLLSATQHGDVGLVEGLIERANQRLQEIFRTAWQQSEITIRLRTDNVLLHVLVSNPGGGYSSIAERSDGLRTFVALVAFCARHPTENDLILLIDEAESHLHYDAQADLIRMLTRQRVARQVFYTTHSIGCLPQDLGAGIRVVAPMEGQQRSIIHNSFWTAGPGLSPLMLGMGATLLAFTPARNAVISEGGADAVLMPTLLREAAGAPVLGFQVVPGLAELRSEAMAVLDAEAGRVAYLVDGDDGGRKVHSRLVRAGIDKRRIAIIGGTFAAKLTPEDLIAKNVYLSAVNEELRRSHGEEIQLTEADVPDANRQGALAAWCESHGIDLPNRVVIASRIVEHADEHRLLSEAHMDRTRELFNTIERALRER